MLQWYPLQWYPFQGQSQFQFRGLLSRRITSARRKLLIQKYQWKSRMPRKCHPEWSGVLWVTLEFLIYRQALISSPCEKWIIATEPYLTGRKSTGETN